MYLFITTRCNMSCSHCAYSCTEVGEDMNMDVFKKAVDLSAEYMDSVVLGGGEPTLHPQFLEMLGYAIICCPDVEDGGVFIATNGSNKDISLKLAHLAKNCVISACLSLDDYHDISMVDKSVIKAFTRPGGRGVGYYESYGGYHENSDYREIRDVTGKEILSGRCTWGEPDRCICPGLCVYPNGDVYACGCEDSPKLCTVDNFKIPDNWDMSECWKYEENREILEEMGLVDKVENEREVINE